MVLRTKRSALAAARRERRLSFFTMCVFFDDTGISEGEYHFHEPIFEINHQGSKAVFCPGVKGRSGCNGTPSFFGKGSVHVDYF